MVGIRDIRNQARKDLHQAMQVPALYYAQKGDEGVAVSVRLHTKFDALGGRMSPGSDENYGGRVEEVPRAVFLLSEISPSRNAVFACADGTYRIDYVEPPHGLTVTANVKKVPDKELADFPAPEA